MTPERWQQIDQLFHAALAREPAERSGFIAAQCGDDEILRVEVESLISFHQQDQSFFETPASDIAAEMLGCHRPTFRPGTEIQSYKIVKELGSGGMGEVYLANDTRLNRQIALKLLPAHFTMDPARLRRFEREASAASALNHPNIVTVHEIGQTDSTRFIATEFIDGVTLRQHLAEVSMSLGDVIDVAAQVALALAAAHEAGIVHRDIKPENIMLRPDGFVKVLDFGLAKLESRAPAVVGLTETRTATLKTDPGMVMGTVRYMSPEQARGGHIDGRTDIWSLGVVLYEMLAGEEPFRGETSSHVIVSILENEPRPFLDGEIPSELWRIIAKSLSKDRQGRYGTAGEMAHDLKMLKEELTLESRLEKFRRLDEGQRTQRQTQTLSGHTGAVVSTPASVAMQRDAVGGKKAQRLVLVGLLSLMIIGAVFIFSKVVLRKRVSPYESAFLRTQTARLTNTGNANLAAISPDGKYVAYSVKDKNGQGLWIRQPSDLNSVPIVPPAEVGYVGVTFSNDSNDVYYVIKPRNVTFGTLYRVPKSGGTPTKLISDVDSSVGFSPDGQRLAFIRGSVKGEFALMVANVDGSGERKLSVRQSPDLYVFSGPAWSPDGSKILCAAGNNAGGKFYENVVEVQVDTGVARPVSDRKWGEIIGRIVWFADGSGFVMPASDRETDGRFQLWHVSYPAGTARRISHDFSDYTDIGMTADGSGMIGVHVQSAINIWLMSHEDGVFARSMRNQLDVATGDFKQLTFGVDRDDGQAGIAFTADGKIIYRSRASGREQLWRMNSDGGDQKQLTNPQILAYPLTPFVIADGLRILFVATTGYANIWSMNADGGDLKQLTNGRGEFFPAASPDGKSLVYGSNDSGKQTIWKMSIENPGPAVQVTAERANFPIVSPDGKWIACNYRNEQGGGQWRIAIVPFEGGPPTKIFEIPSGTSLRPIRWSPDGSAITFISRGEEDSIISSQPIDGGPIKKLIDFKTEKIFDFTWSSDGRRLALSRGTIATDVVLIKNLPQ